MYIKRFPLFAFIEFNVWKRIAGKYDNSFHTLKTFKI